MSDEIFKACEQCDSYCLPRPKVEEFVKLTESYQARIEKLRAALQMASRHCTHSGEGHYELGSFIRKALAEDDGK